MKLTAGGTNYSILVIVLLSKLVVVGAPDKVTTNMKNKQAKSTIPACGKRNLNPLTTCWLVSRTTAEGNSSENSGSDEEAVVTVTFLSSTDISASSHLTRPEFKSFHGVLKIPSTLSG